MIEKYKEELEIGTYLAIKAEIDMLKEVIKGLQDENEKVASYIEYVSKLKTASLKEKLIFLFKKQ